MTHHNEHTHEHHKTLFQKPLILLLSVIIFCVLFITIFYLGKASAIKNYDTANSKVPSIVNFGADPQTLDIFTNYGALFGIVFGLIILVSLYIWHGIASLFKLTKHKLTIPIIMFIVYGFWFLFGLKLAFFEKGYATWANGIIYFIGIPLFYSSLIMIILTLIILFLSGKRAVHNE